jgi:hypothetical protein
MVGHDCHFRTALSETEYPARLSAPFAAQLATTQSETPGSW